MKQHDMWGGPEKPYTPPLPPSPLEKDFFLQTQRQYLFSKYLFCSIFPIFLFKLLSISSLVLLFFHFFPFHTVSWYSHPKKESHQVLGLFQRLLYSIISTKFVPLWCNTYVHKLFFNKMSRVLLLHLKIFISIKKQKKFAST